MIFSVLNPEKFDINSLYICPPHLYTVATLPWESKKVFFFHSIIHTYFTLFTSSQNKTNCYPLTHHTWKMSSHYLVKCKTFSSDWKYVAFLQTLVALKRASCGLALVALKRTGFDAWQLECQVSNVIASVQSDHLLHGYMLPVFFATDQWHCPPRSAEIQPMSRQDVSAIRQYRGLVFDRRAVAACPRCGNLTGWGQGCWLATCQDWWTGVSHGAKARLCHKHDVLAHCLAGRQTHLQQCCGSLVAASASPTRLTNTSRWFLLQVQRR